MWPPCEQSKVAASSVAERSTRIGNDRWIARGTVRDTHSRIDMQGDRVSQMVADRHTAGEVRSLRLHLCRAVQVAIPPRAVASSILDPSFSLP